MSFTNPRFQGDISQNSSYGSTQTTRIRNGSTLAKNGIDKQVYAGTICPHLRIGIRAQELTPDPYGWVDRKQLESYLVKAGLKRHSLLLWFLSFGGRNNSPRNKAKQIKLSTFKGTALDHGSSSGILNNEKGLDSTRLEQFKRFAVKVGNEKRLYTENFAQVANALHKRPVNFKATFFGQYLQLLEFKIILEVYGRIDHERNEKYLSYSDLSNWKQGKSPKAGSTH